MFVTAALVPFHLVQTVMEVGRDNFDILYDATIKYEMWEDEGLEGAGLPPSVASEWLAAGGPQCICKHIFLMHEKVFEARWQVYTCCLYHTLKLIL